jgi:glycerophosphoryl diester phosphodiesterase
VEFQRPGRPLVVGHRGAPRLAPPNTLDGLAAAVAAGADMVEFDVGAGLVLGHPGETPPGPPPSLDQALAALAPHGIGIHVDLKERGIEGAVAEAVRRHGVAGRTCVSATWPEAVRVASSALVRGVMPLRARLLVARGRAGALSLHHRLVSPRVVDAVHGRGAALMAWTVNDPARVERLARAGVDAIITDDPEMALGVLATLSGL